MSRKYQAEQFITISGGLCFTEAELRMVVRYVVHPAEKQTLIDPGQPRFAEVESIRLFYPLTKVELSPIPAWFDAVFENSSACFLDWLLDEASEQDSREYLEAGE